MISVDGKDGSYQEDNVTQGQQQYLYQIITPRPGLRTVGAGKACVT